MLAVPLPRAFRRYRYLSNGLFIWSNKLSNVAVEGVCILKLLYIITVKVLVATARLRCVLSVHLDL